jgi:hypothetical protein
MLTEIPSQEFLLTSTDEYRQLRNADVGLGVAIQPAGARSDVYMVLITPEGTQQFLRPYGGPPEYAPRWALHHSLDIIRML